MYIFVYLFRNPGSGLAKAQFRYHASVVLK